MPLFERQRMLWNIECGNSFFHTQKPTLLLVNHCFSHILKSKIISYLWRVVESYRGEFRGSFLSTMFLAARTLANIKIWFFGRQIRSSIDYFIDYIIDKSKRILFGTHKGPRKQKLQHGEYKIPKIHLKFPQSFIDASQSKKNSKISISEKNHGSYFRRVALDVKKGVQTFEFESMPCITSL